MFTLGISVLYPLSYSFSMILLFAIAINVITAYTPSRINHVSSVIALVVTVLTFGQLVVIKTYDVSNIQALSHLIALFLTHFGVILVITMLFFMFLANGWIRDGRNGAPTPSEYYREGIKHAKTSFQKKTTDQKG